MRCTECEAEIKPVVAVDIDGTLGDFHTHFLRFAEAYLFGAKPDHDAPFDLYSGAQTMKEWFCSHYGVEESTWHDIKLAYRQGAQKRSMPCYSHSAELTHRIRDVLGAELWLTTTRPYLRLDNIDPDTRFWLDRNGITYDYVIYDEQKFSRLLARVGEGRVVAVLDDLGEELDVAKELFGQDVCLLWKAFHNQYDWSDWTMVYNFTGALYEIAARIKEWKRVGV